jgi:uncharacterized protein (TIGR02246 family)
MMSRCSLAGLILLGFLIVAPAVLPQDPKKDDRASKDQQSVDSKTPGAAVAEDRPADREVIAKLAQEFREAFEKGDAKALAAYYTEQCEYYDDTTGEVFRGRAEVEKAYADLFKNRPGRKVVVQSKSLRFLGRDTAIQEGLVRIQSVGSEMPVSTRYSVICAREDGQWKIALEREWGVNEDKLDDLSWLIGEWTARTKDRELHMSFRWNDKKTLIVDKFTVKEGGKISSSGTQRIGVDAKSGLIRSWLVDQNGSRGQSFWIRDGNSWLLDSAGTLANGAETSSMNIISRIDDDAFTWRSVDRRIGSDELPPTDPIKVVRVRQGN